LAESGDANAPIEAMLHLFGANLSSRETFTAEDWTKKGRLSASLQPQEILDAMRTFRRSGSQVGAITPETRTNWGRLPDALKATIWELFLSEVVAEQSVDRMLPSSDRMRYGQGRGTWRENWADVALGRRIESADAARKLDRQSLAEGAMDLAGGVSLALREWGEWTSSNSVSALKFPPIQIPTDLGSVWITDSSSNKIPLGAALVFDLGGDDEYTTPDPLPLTAAPLVQLIVDLDGNDTYTDQVGGYLACGIGGISAIYDENGKDEFRTAGMGIGCGILGAGWVTDMLGDDTIIADGPFAVGAGANGAGAFYTFGGKNHFVSQGKAFGFGGPNGVGVFCSAGSSDTYEMKGPNCLGANYGGAGIGLACDASGDDKYSVDHSSLGSGETGGFGFFWDESGADTYRVGERCLGSGISGGFGLAGDAKGNDQYTSMEGLGYAKAGTGVFLDFEGDDHYESSYGLGYSLQSGVSFFWDRIGADTYKLMRDRPGFASAGTPSIFPLSQSPSVALFLDSAGSDVYDHPEIKDGSNWTGGDALGFGCDILK